MAQSNNTRRGEAPSNSNKHQSGLFRPSICERPVLRLRYITPTGSIEQTTVHSSWHPWHADPEAVKRTVADSYRTFYTSIGCTLTHIEFITHSTTEFYP